ncbi:EIF3A [Cordylochernes scorpioides]|uniref:Eukaryotic translation initiation factor 3 subunit A n=1 Tax=Cordylochernes scorpioides TaxID=51811 RepID=A0ABY6KN80_9ARAC|nr:EIF3A [Cordylochernes scorpioides]
MPHHFQKPENALKRASEFIEVGKHQRALSVLLDVVKSRRHRTWQKVHEPIILKYLALCVDLKKSHLAKEGLFHYRNMCQYVNAKSLEEAVGFYLRLAEARTERARADCHQLLPHIDDLDNVQTPESVILTAVSGEQPAITLLTPWVKFLWESYKHCLELLRNNSKVERLYHDIAQKAMKFCVAYERKTEFRKLYDNLRGHLGHLHKHGHHQVVAINLSNPESQALHLETRMVQLDTAITMELWQEAFKAIEDINALMSILSKSAKISLLATYYQKVALVFWKAANILFHASSLLKYFQLVKETKRYSSSELQNLASRVVIAVLAIPRPSFFIDTDFLVERDESLFERHQIILASLLNLSTPPTKSSLIRDLVKLGLVTKAHPLVQEIYKLFVKEPYPVDICTLISDHYRKLYVEIPELKQYEQPIQDIALVSMLKTLSHIYVSLKFKELARMVPFAADHQLCLERKIVEAAKRNNLNLRFDHRNQCLHFRCDVSRADGDRQQTCLARLYSSLRGLMSSIRPKLVESNCESLKHRLVEVYDENKEVEYRALLERKRIIEERKELLETLCLQKEEEERKLLEQKQQRLREAEMERITREAEARTKQRILSEQNEMKKKVALEKLEQLKKTDIGAQLFERLEKKLEKIDSEEILYRQLEKEKIELSLRLRKQERMKDHVERSKRLEEVPLLKREYEEYKIEARAIFEKSEEEKLRESIEEYHLNLQHKYRMDRIIKEKDKILNIFKAAVGTPRDHNMPNKKDLELRRAKAASCGLACPFSNGGHGWLKNYEYQVKLYKFNQILDREREKRLNERNQRRKEERKRDWLILREERERRRKLEEQRIAEEMHKAKLDEIESKKRAKEQEVEEKLRRDRQLRFDRLKEEQRFALWKPAAASSLWKSRRDDGEWERGSWRKVEEQSEWPTRSEARDWRAQELHRLCDGRSVSRAFDLGGFDGNERKGVCKWNPAPVVRSGERKARSDLEDWRRGEPDCFV